MTGQQGSTAILSAVASGGGGGTVNSVTAGDASIAIGGTAANPTVETGTLDQAANLHPAAADWSNNSHKITSLANGSAASDAAAFGQIPTALPPNGSASGDLSGTYPSPSVAKVNALAVPASKTIVGTNSSSQFIDASASTLANNTTGTAANLTGGATLPAYLAPHVATLTDGASVAIDVSLGNDFRWTLAAGSHTLAVPSNPVNGQAITIAIKYSGSFTPLFNAVYDFGSAGQPPWSAVSGKTDYVGFRYDSALNAAAGAWAYMGSVLGLTS